MIHEKILRRVGGRFERRAERFSVRVCSRRPRLRQAICPRQAPARVLDAGMPFEESLHRLRFVARHDPARDTLAFSGLSFHACVDHQ